MTGRRYHAPPFEQADPEGFAAATLRAVESKSNGNGAGHNGQEPVRGLGATPRKAGHGYARRFPLEALPERLRVYVENLAERKQVPVDLPAMCSLGCISALAGPRLLIRRDLDWMQTLNLYIVVAMDSGGAKSPAVNELLEGVELAQGRLVADHNDRTREDLEGWQQEQERIKRLANAAGVSKVMQDEYAAKLRDINTEITKLQDDPPPPPRFLIDGDITPERLAARLSANHGAGAIIDPEGTFLRHLAGDMYGTGKGGNAVIVLKGLDGEYCHPERIGQGRTDPIRRPILALFIAPQPGILATMLANEQLNINGAINRFLIVVPGDLVGQRQDRPSVYYQDAPAERVETGFQQWWADLLAGLVRYPIIGSDTPEDQRIDLSDAPTLNLSREAWERHCDYEREFEKRIHPQHRDATRLKAWGSKHLARVLRLAGILHLAAELPVDVEVSEDTMDRAIAVGEWAVEHFLAAGPAAGMSEGAGRLAEFIEASDDGRVYRAQINKAVYHNHASKQAIDGWIAELVASGRYHVLRQKTSGRPREWVLKSGMSLDDLAPDMGVAA